MAHMYTPISPEVFVAAFCGALGGMRDGRFARSIVESFYNSTMDQAGAWAHAFDQAFNDENPSDVELRNIEELSRSQWSGRISGSAADWTAYSDSAEAVKAMVLDANAWLTEHVSPLPPPPAANTQTDTFTAGDGQTVFVLSETPNDVLNSQVSINGVGVFLTANYTIVGSTLTWTGVPYPLDGDTVLARYTY